MTERFRVTPLNLQGFHGSACIAPGIEGYADRLASVFAPGGLSKETIVIGNGFGGTAAVAMAVRRGNEFSKLVLSDVAASFPPEGRKAFGVMATKVQNEGIGSIATISANRVFHEAYLADHPGAVDERRRGHSAGRVHCHRSW